MDETTDTLEKNKEIVSRFFSIFSSGNVEGITACMTADCSWWVSGNVSGISGSYSRDEMGELLRGVVNVYKQGALAIKATGMTAESNRVAAEAESFAELQNGRLFNNTYHFLFEIQDGKLKRIKEYSDTLHLYETFIES